MRKIKQVPPLNYAFAIGKIRALENFLLKEEVFTEAIDLSLNEALKLFVESDLYSEELLQVRDSRNLETVLSQEMAKLKNLIKGLLLDKDLFCVIESDGLGQSLKKCQVVHSKFLRDYLMHALDMHNIKTFLRLYFLKEPEEKLQSAIAGQGFIPEGVFLNCYHQDLPVFLNRLEFAHKGSQIINYALFLEEPIQKIKQNNSFVALEKAINDFLIQILKPAKYLSSGPEPLLGYYFAKVNEMNLMRLIILAKLNDLPKDLVKERLNSVYA
jgi:V/A-type H+-transporting ATPase subunit C